MTSLKPNSYRKVLDDLLAGAVMSKFCTAEECASYRQAIRDCMDALWNDEPVSAGPGDAERRDSADLAWRLEEAMKVIREFPGLLLERDYNNWLFKRDRVLALGPMPAPAATAESGKA